jgi:phytoene dehydrogenase-like protein
MPSYDVVIIGAGAAGLTAGALLAKEGKRVVVLDRSPYIGGRAMALPDEGFIVNLGGHLIEDGGSGITKVFEHVGKELVHGEVSNEMPIWENGRGWGSVRDRYTDRAELKKVIRALVDTPYEALDEGTVALRRRASSRCIKQGGKNPQAPCKTRVNRTYEGLSFGFWTGKWSRLGGPIAQCNSAVTCPASWSAA